MKVIPLGVVLILVAVLSSVGHPETSRAEHRTLFSQSAAQILNRDFNSSDISYLLLDARTGQFLASRWEHADAPIPLGSLDKPFAAIAYGEKHDFQFPAHTCRGSATGCWRPAGHGNVGLISAIAYSCNSYFRMLTSQMTASDLSSTAVRFGLDAPGVDASGSALAGLGPQWKIAPVRMAQAYVELAHEHGQAAVREILEGMADSARFGTGAEIDRLLPLRNALVKTGTAACTHAHRAPGDGFTVVLVPADDPRVLLMVRVHGVPGAKAAKTAGEMLRRIEE